MSSTPTSNMVAAHQMEKLPSDREKWENEFKDYAEAEAADFIEFLEGIPEPPEEITEDMTLIEKRDLKTAKNEYIRRQNQAWKFIHNILKDSHLKSFIKKFAKQENRAFKAWTAINNHFNDQNPAQLQLILQHKLENVAVENSGDIKFDFLQCRDTFDSLFQNLEDNPPPYNVTHTTQTKKIFLQSALAKCPRFTDILKQCTAKATGYIKYQEEILKVIDNQVLLDKLRNNNPTTVTNQIIQAKNETTNVTSLISKITEGENIDYEAIAENEGPDKLRALHSTLRDNMKRLKRASQKLNRYNKRDHPYNDNNTNNNNEYDNYNNNDNYDNQYEYYNNSSHNSNNNQNSHNSDQQRNFHNDHNSDHNRQYNNNNKYYNNNYNNKNYNNNNYRGRGRGGRGHWQGRGRGKGRGYYDDEQFGYDNRNGYNNHYNDYQRRDNYNNNYDNNYNYNGNNNYNNNQPTAGTPANNQQGTYPNNQPNNFQQPQQANLTYYPIPPIPNPTQPFTLNTALPLTPPIPPNFNNNISNPYRRY